MEITYRWTQEFTAEALELLFLSVDWSSGRHPYRVQLALANSHSVYSAWHDGRLIGLMNALSDEVMCTYFQYLLVMPQYQGQGVGRALVAAMRERYKDVARLSLIAMDDAIGFYECCGFQLGQNKSPMSITWLDT